MSRVACWRTGRRRQRARGARRRTRYSRSKSYTELMRGVMVDSEVPLRGKLHNKVSNMVSVEQSKKQSIAARSSGRCRVVACGWMR